MGRSRKVVVVVLAFGALTAATNASAAIKEPSALVAATFTLTAQQPYVQQACPFPNLYDGLYIELKGTETDTSNPPHPELTGNLQMLAITFLNAMGSTASAGTIKATLTDDTGQILYSGEGTFTGSVTHSNHVLGRGLLTARLYENGTPTNRLLLANFTLDQSLFDYNITGQLGQGSSVPTFAIETAGVCPAG